MTIIDIPHFSFERPPIWDYLMEKYGAPAWEDVPDRVCTYDGIIYVQDDLPPPDVIVHEMVHLKQQKEFAGTAIEYADKYMSDGAFRYETELAAYRKQWNYIRSHHGDRSKALRKLAEQLSGPVYGYVVPFQKALQDIIRSSP